METNYDYIIIGGGSSGCAVAGRLSEDPSVSVCLLEAGPRDTSPLIHIPTGIMRLASHKKLNWQFLTKPQAAMKNRPLVTPRGKTLGGSSSINAMVYIRGNRLDYDEWAELGNDGWNWEGVKQYFLKAENNEQFKNQHHSQGGPLNVTFPNIISPLEKDFVEAAESLQYKHNPDFNGETQEGIGIHQTTQKNGRRWSSARAYIHPVISRKNLSVFTEAAVKRIKFDGKLATGVELMNGQELKAKKEIILSAGSIVSPKILMLSGIGDPSELESHKIETIHKLPGVGKNLQDHAAIHVFMKTKSRVPWGFSWPKVPSFAFDVFRYLFFRKGWFSASLIESGGFIKSHPDLERPDIQLVFVPGHRALPPKWIEIGHGYASTAVLLRPKSRGSVRLNSKDPNQPPLIDQNFFSEEGDIEKLLWGLKECRRIVNSDVFSKYQPTELLPGKSVQTDEDLTDYIRQFGGTIFHPSGTCKMGSDKEAVVNNRLKVHGIQGLRVVDISIMPKIIGGNTNAAAIMIGEKAADMIKQDNN